MTALIPIDDTPFKDLAVREQAQVLATAEHYFFGLKMQQHPQAVVRLNQLLNLIQPRTIVEIGSGNAGLSYLFALYAANTGGRYAGFDLIEGKHAAMLNDHFPQVGGTTRADVLTDAHNVEQFARNLAAMEGRTMLVCDAGKALEANLYIPSLKVGDFVLMHDHSPDAATFERDLKGRVWNWFESWDERVAEMCAKHGIVQTTALHDVVWFCGWKTR